MDDLLPPNPYKTLSIPKDATLATIRGSYRKLVLSCHPDKVQDETAKKVKAEQFHQVQQAYEILSDDKRRQRYDEKVKLEELRAEMETERGPPIRRTTDYDYGPPRSGPPPKNEMRGGRMYETREPKGCRSSDEDYPPSKYDIRPPFKKHDDYYYPSSARRTSGRVAEERRKDRDIEEDRERKRREREAESLARDQRTKKRDKDRRWDTENKSKSKFSPHMDTETDSEVDDRRYSSKKERESIPRYRTEEPPRRSREDPRKSSKFDPRYHDDELDLKISAYQEHINRSREAVEIEPARRTERNRATSNLDTQKRSPPPPVSSEKRPPLRRAQGSRQPSPIRSSKKDRRSPEISAADPPTGRKSSLPNASSDPKGIKGFFTSSSKREVVTPRREPARSATHQPSADSKHPPMRRSETTPIDRMGPGNAFPLKSSNLKNMKAHSDYTNSSESGSETTEDVVMPLRPSPRQRSTSYRVHQDEDKFKVEPQEIFPTRPPREGSPKARRSSDRPIASRSSTNARIPPLPRANSYAFPQDDRSSRPGFSRTESARPTPLKAHQSPRNDRLFGEQSPTEEAFKHRHPPKVHPDDNGRYAKSYSRRGSDEVDRDAYLSSNFHSHRPRMGRNETVF